MSTLKKVQPGDPLRIPASTFNSMVDAARAFKGRQHDEARQPSLDTLGADVVLVKHTSMGGDCPRFGSSGDTLRMM